MGDGRTTREVRWERMFPDELETAIEARPVVYFGYGLCEPHGPHNAVGLDTLKAHGICCAAARAHGGVVAPPDYWHVHEVGLYASFGVEQIGESRPWLTAVPPWIHFKNICYHLRAADALGFKAAILITGHYGPNWQDLKTVVELLQPHLAMRLWGLPDFEANQPGFDSDGKTTRDHAGMVETSLLWALEPDCVDMSRLPDADAPGPHFAMGSTARRSDRRVGERMVADQVRWLGEKAKALLAAYEREVPQPRQPRSFEDVERIWAEHIQPRVPTFKSMQMSGEPPHTARTVPAADSQWRLNYQIPDVERQVNS